MTCLAKCSVTCSAAFATGKAAASGGLNAPPISRGRSFHFFHAYGFLREEKTLTDLISWGYTNGCAPDLPAACSPGTCATCPRPETDRLEAKQLRLCLLSKIGLKHYRLQDKGPKRAAPGQVRFFVHIPHFDAKQKMVPQVHVITPQIS